MRVEHFDTQKKKKSRTFPFIFEMEMNHFIMNIYIYIYFMNLKEYAIVRHLKLFIIRYLKEEDLMSTYGNLNIFRFMKN